MNELLLPGLLSGIGFLFICVKLNIRRICGYDVIVDIFCTSLLAYIFFGTFSGMMSAIVGGIFISISLIVYKKIWGYERLIRVSGLKFEWKYFDPLKEDVK